MHAQSITRWASAVALAGVVATASVAADSAQRSRSASGQQVSTISAQGCLMRERGPSGERLALYGADVVAPAGAQFAEFTLVPESSSVALYDHVGRQVEVTGTAVDVQEQEAGSQPVTLVVTTVRRVAASCETGR